MARLPRLLVPGGIYHVSNVGAASGRRLFPDAAAAQTFLDALEYGSERMRWRVLAFSVLKDRYHMAIQTADGNLSDGVHWIQRAFSNRVRSPATARGPVFRHRFRASLVEPGEFAEALVDYIHATPVFAGIVSTDLLPKFRWSSYRYFVGRPSDRFRSLSMPAADSVKRAEESLRNLILRPDANVAHGWARFETSPVAHGSAEFRARINATNASVNASAAPRTNHAEWEERFRRALAVLGRRPGELDGGMKRAPWKIAVATWMKRSTAVSNRWLTERLDMGPPDAVSRYVGECERGQQPAASVLIELIESELAAGA